MIIILKHSATLQDFVVKVDDEIGEGILKSGIQSVNAVAVTNPLAIVPQQDPNSGGVRVGLMPFSFTLEEDTEIIWDSSHFLTAFKAHKEMEQLYIKHTSNIQIASSLEGVGKP